MNVYILKYLIEYLSVHQRSAKIEEKRRREVRSLIIIYSVSSVIELLCVALVAYALTLRWDNEFGASFKTMANIFGLTLICIHSVWVCMSFKLIQNLATSKEMVAKGPAKNVQVDISPQAQPTILLAETAIARASSTRP